MFFGGMGHLWRQPVLPQRLGQPFMTDGTVRPGDPGLSTQLGELDAGALRQRMLSRHGEINGVVHDQQALEAVRQHQGRIHPVVDQRDVEMARDDQADRLVRLPLGHPKPELLVVLPKPGNGLVPASKCGAPLASSPTVTKR